ncbi:hypothetical protein, partial [Escherichia coli]|uniref:hypothetical protein n=1 Tax=Escherichia coli TaxID=562 RepID=UPI001AEBB3C5
YRLSSRSGLTAIFFIPARYPVNLSSALPLTGGKPCLVFPPEPARNNGHKQVSLIIIKSHQGSGGKTKHGLPPVNGNAEERF